MVQYDAQITASSEDASQAVGGTVSITTPIHSIQTGTEPWSGYRFTSVPIPRNATITAATWEIHTTGTGFTDDEVDLDIYGEKVGTSATYTTASSSISSRTRTTAKVTWTAAHVGFTTWIISPDISTVIQEIVNQSTWSSGNHLSIIANARSSSLVSIDSSDQSPTGTVGAKLHVTWTQAATTPLSAWYALHNDIGSLRMCTYGDSITFGGAIDFVGGWVGQLRTLTAARWGNGGDGYQTLNNLDPSFSRFWSWTTGGDAWTSSTVNDLWSGGPLNQGTCMANGATKIATWTNSGGANVTCDSFELLCIDGASAADFSYSTNGGSTWTNAGFSGFTGSNVMKKITINTPVATTLKIRGANAAGTGVNVYLAGIAVKKKTPGLIIDNCGVSGQFLGVAIDPPHLRPWYDYINLYQPKLVTCCFTNDAAFQIAVDVYENRLQVFTDLVKSYGGDVILMSFWEQTGREAAEVTMRAAVKSVAASRGVYYIDFYDYDIAHGGAGDGIANGHTDGGHETDAGALVMATEVWKLISKRGSGWRNRI